MSLKDYLKSKVGTIFLNVIASILLSVFLLSIGNEVKAIITIVSSWIIIISISFFIAYKKRKDYFKLVEKSISNIDKKYLISEVLEMPPFIEAEPYYYLLKNQVNQ